MAYDDGLAQIFRDDLADEIGLSEKKMFGGLCFLLNGNMLCGVMSKGIMFRVGKDSEAEALSIEGIEPLSITGQKMGGIVEASGEFMADEEARATALNLALGFVRSLPAK